MKNNLFAKNIRNLFGKSFAVAFLFSIFAVASFAQTPSFTGKLVNENNSAFASVEGFGTDFSNMWARVWMSSTTKVRTVFQAKPNENGYYYSRYIEYSYYADEPRNTKYWAELGGGWMAINATGAGYMMADYEVVAYKRVAITDTWKYYRLTE
ncbi:MAG: hypothetical protein AAB336_08645 [Acidobacteriota bacterium]